jgi:hypothetical protein
LERHYMLSIHSKNLRPLMAFALKDFELIMLHLELMILLLILSQGARPSIILVLVPTTKMVSQSVQFKLLRVGPVLCSCIVSFIGLSRLICLYGPSLWSQQFIYGTLCRQWGREPLPWNCLAPA